MAGGLLRAWCRAAGFGGGWCAFVLLLLPARSLALLLGSARRCAARAKAFFAWAALL